MYLEAAKANFVLFKEQAPIQLKKISAIQHQIEVQSIEKPPMIPLYSRWTTVLLYTFKFHPMGQ